MHVISNWMGLTIPAIPAFRWRRVRCAASLSKARGRVGSRGGSLRGSVAGEGAVTVGCLQGWVGLGRTPLEIEIRLLLMGKEPYSRVIDATIACL